MVAYKDGSAHDTYYIYEGQKKGRHTRTKHYSFFYSSTIFLLPFVSAICFNHLFQPFISKTFVSTNRFSLFPTIVFFSKVTKTYVVRRVVGSNHTERNQPQEVKHTYEDTRFLLPTYFTVKFCF